MSQQPDPKDSATPGGKHYVYLHRRLDAALAAIAHAHEVLENLKTENAAALTGDTPQTGRVMYAAISELQLAIAALSIPVVTRPG